MQTDRRTEIDISIQLVVLIKNISTSWGLPRILQCVAIIIMKPSAKV